MWAKNSSKTIPNNELLLINFRAEFYKVGSLDNCELQRKKFN